MFRQLGVVISTLLVVFTVSGCSTKPSSSTPPSAQTNPSTTDAKTETPATETAPAINSSEKSSLFTTNEFPENEVTAALPAPKFSVNASSVTTDSQRVSVTYDNVPEDEVVSYIKQVKDAGFTYWANEHKSNDSYSYDAQNTENYLQATTFSLYYGSDGSLRMEVRNNAL